MIELGKFIELSAYRDEPPGWYLVDEDGDEVLLPNKFVPEGTKKGDEIKVFIYLDNEERMTATTQIPLIEINHFAFLEVMDVNKYGAFVDWGLDKQLMVPYREQKDKMEVGRKYIIYLTIDTKTDRFIGSTKWEKYIDNEELNIAIGDEVNLIIANKTDLGRNVIINHSYKGLIFNNQIYKKINKGDHIKGFIKEIRTGNKIDVVLEKPGFKNSIEPNTQKILQYLEDHNGYMPFNDKSDPNDIRLNFEMSKKNFKKSLGGLFKSKKIRIEKDGVYLLE